MRPIRPTHNERTSTVLKWLAIVVAVGFVAVFAFSATLRLLYPYEVEWMEGSMIDHAIRVFNHQPIYTAPSVDFVPWLYTPGYYYVVAAVMHLTGIGFLAGRLVSVIATLVTVVLIGLMVRRSTGSTLLAAFGGALYIAAYHATGYYFDIARNDALFVMLAILAGWVSIRGDLRAGLLALVVLTAAFYTKQQEVFFGPLIVLWFLLRSRRVGLIVAAISLVVVIACLFVSNTETSGWFTYFVFDIPAAKRADFSLLHALRVIPDYVLGSFAISSIAVLALVISRVRSGGFWKSTSGLFVLLWLGSIAAGAMSLGNEGGYRNVMMPLAAFSALLLPIALHELKPTVKLAGFVWLGLLLQLLALSFDPTGEKMLFAGSRQRAGASEIVKKIAAIPGNVYIPYHGYIARQAGKSTYAHVLATMDVMRMHDTTARRLARDFDSAYATGFSAVILEESKAFDANSVKGYRFGGKLIERPNVGITRVADEATRPNLLWLRDTISP